MTKGTNIILLEKNIFSNKHFYKLLWKQWEDYRRARYGIGMYPSSAVETKKEFIIPLISNNYLFIINKMYCINTTVCDDNPKVIIHENCYYLDYQCLEEIDGITYEVCRCISQNEDVSCIFR